MAVNALPGRVNSLSARLSSRRSPVDGQSLPGRWSTSQ